MRRTTARFWASSGRLPEGVQRAVRQIFELLKENPAHPSVHFKKIGTLRSARIGLNYRALAVEDGGDYIWTWIGSHDETTRIGLVQDSLSMELARAEWVFPMKSESHELSRV